MLFTKHGTAVTPDDDGLFIAVIRLLQFRDDRNEAHSRNCFLEITLRLVSSLIMAKMRAAIDLIKEAIKMILRDGLSSALIFSGGRRIFVLTVTDAAAIDASSLFCSKVRKSCSLIFLESRFSSNSFLHSVCLQELIGLADIALVCGFRYTQVVFIIKQNRIRCCSAFHSASCRAPACWGYRRFCT